MGTTLPEQLRGMAEEATRSTDPALGRALWTRGRRYQRRRRVGTALIVATSVVAMLAAGVFAWQRAAPPAEPLPADAPTGLPDRIYEPPNRWLPTTTDAGPLGHVVAVLPSVERGEWWGSRFDAVGISATTGEYRFLDLDDRGFPLDSEMALSPGGRWLAYWTTGTPIGSPNTTHDTITGIALYDAVTDDVRRYEIETQHGVSPFALTWIDPDTVSVGVGQFQGGGDDGFSRLTAELLWHATEPAPRPDDRSKAERRHDAWDTEGTLLSPSRTRAAGPALGFADDQGPVEVTPIDPATGRRAAAAATVPDSRAYGVLGWTDEDHVVTYSVEEEDFPRAVALDVTTGEARSLVRLPEGNAGTILWARDLWGSPVVPAEEPPRPVDPRLLPGMVAAVVVLGGLLLVLWRRRVRP